MIAPGGIYHLTRQIRLAGGRIVTVVRRVRVLAVEDNMVTLDNGDGTYVSVEIEIFEQEIEEDY